MGLEQSGSAMGKYILVSLALIDLAILEFAAILAMKRNQCFRQIANNGQPMDIAEHEHLYCQIDRVSFWLYIFIFIVFNSIYWPIYI